LISSGTVGQAYGYVDAGELELEEKSITEEDYWLNGPYKITGWTSESYYVEILRESYERYRLIYRSKFNFTHVIENKKIPHGSFAYHGIKSSRFLEYVYDKTNCIYDSGNINIWRL